MLTLSVFCGCRESSVLNSAAALMKARGFLPRQLGGVRLEGRGTAELTQGGMCMVLGEQEAFPA